MIFLGLFQFIYKVILFSVFRLMVQETGAAADPSWAVAIMKLSFVCEQYLDVLDETAGELLAHFPHRLAWETGSEVIKKYILMGLSQKSKDEVATGDRVLETTTPKERTKDHNIALTKRKNVFAKVHRIYKTMENSIYGEPLPAPTPAGIRKEIKILYVYLIIKRDLLF